jgi:hypothetical protein
LQRILLSLNKIFVQYDVILCFQQSLTQAQKERVLRFSLLLFLDENACNDILQCEHFMWLRLAVPWNWATSNVLFMRVAPMIMTVEQLKLTRRLVTDED